MIHRGYEAFKVHTNNNNKPLKCPHCDNKQDDSVEDHCVRGRPDRSKTECVRCFKPFGVIFDGDFYYVVKLNHITDNIC